MAKKHGFMKRTSTILGISFLLFSCTSDDNYLPIRTTLDSQLTTLLIDASEGKGLSYFIFPESDEYSKIPQDPKNPITKAKVDLGKLLLHETALGGQPKINEMKATYTCASCHNSGAGFGAGLRQGIGECGVGFGVNGNGRLVNQNVPIDSIDVQPIRVPTLLNVAYQDVALWNGQFGGTGTNEGTEASWTDIPENFLGFQGIEVQGIKGQDVHRLLVNETFVDTFGYREMFDKAFADVAQNERYTKINAGKKRCNCFFW